MSKALNREIVRSALSGGRMGGTLARPLVDRLESRRLLSAVLPGQTVGTTGITVAAEPDLAGTVIHDALIPFTVSAGGHTVFKGDLQDRVVRETSTGTLDFYQTIRSDAGFSTQSLLQYVTRYSFGGTATDADYSTDSLGDPADHPVSATRSATGKTIAFDFAYEVIKPSTQSLFYFVKTNATQYNLSGSTTLGMQQSAGAATGSVTLGTAEPIALVAPHLPASLVSDLSRQQAAVVATDHDVLTHAAPKKLFADVAVLQGTVSDLTFDVQSLTKTSLLNVESALTKFEGDLSVFYTAVSLGDKTTANAITATGITDLKNLVASATDPAHTNVAQLTKDLTSAAGAVTAHTAALLTGNAAGDAAALAQAAIAIPGIVLDLVGSEVGG